MNNKIFARSIAVIMAVMMLSSVSFAAASLSGGAGDADHTLTVDALADTSQAQETILAFYANTADTNQNPASNDDIIVLEQAEDLATTFSVAKSKAMKPFVIIKRGGTNGTTTSVATKVFEEGQITALGELTLGETTLTDVTVFKKDITPVAGDPAVKKMGVKVVYNNGTTSSEPKDFSSAVTLNGDGTYTYGVVFYNVPNGASLSADYYVLYY